jgi:hypothetical protein
VIVTLCICLAFGAAQSTIKDASGGVDEGDTSAGCAARLVKKWRKSRSMVLKVVGLEPWM